MKMNMTKNLIFLTLLCFLASVQCSNGACYDSTYIIPYSALDYAFDTGFNAVRGKDQLVTLIGNPNVENLKNYIFSIAPFSVPLFVMAGITAIIFIATIIQVICFNTCSKGYYIFLF